MSGGEQKLAGFSRALMEDTKLVILDEPSEGVQQENIMKMAGLMEVAKRNGRSFLLIEQNLDFLMSVSDRVLALESGSAVLSGAIGDLSKQELTETLMV